MRRGKLIGGLAAVVTALGGAGSAWASEAALYIEEADFQPDDPIGAILWVSPLPYFTLPGFLPLEPMDVRVTVDPSRTSATVHDNRALLLTPRANNRCRYILALRSATCTPVPTYPDITLTIVVGSEFLDRVVGRGVDQVSLSGGDDWADVRDDQENRVYCGDGRDTVIADHNDALFNCETRYRG